MKRIVLIALGIVATIGAGVGGYLAGRGGGAGAAGVPAGIAEPAAGQVYTCSMHPQVRLPNPGNCPICEMPLIAASAGNGSSEGPPTLQLSEHALAMASVETIPVGMRRLTHELRAVGKVEYNETSLATITPRVDGYVERLFVNFTGVEVKAGDHLAEVYSPELLVAQQELLIALQAEADASLGDTARTKLRLLGLTDEQVAALEAGRRIADRVTLYSPISGTVIEKMVVEKQAFMAGDALYRIANLDSVWAYLDVYEYDLAWVRYGQRVRISAEALPGRAFEGMVTFVQPLVDERTRTIRVPVHVENADHALRPGMFVSARIEATLGPDGRASPTGVEGMYSCPMHPQVLRGEGGECPICGMPLEQIPGGSGAPHGHETGQVPTPDGPVVGPPGAAEFACPMECEGEKAYDEPGRCPVCDMKLKEVEADAPEETVYSCPMECEGEKTYAEPGRCPVCGMKLKPVERAAPPPEGAVLAIPVSAVLDSGMRRIAYVEKERGLFEPRELTLGPRAGEYYPVLAGVSAGERVATRGNFLIDSQFQVTGHPSLFYPGGLHAQLGHAHGQGGTPEPMPADAGTPSPTTEEHKH